MEGEKEEIKNPEEVTSVEAPAEETQGSGRDAEVGEELCEEEADELGERAVCDPDAEACEACQ